MTFDNRTTEAQQVAQTLGIIVGAASCCEEVTEERVNSVTAKLRRLVSAAADDTSDADAADQEFSAALEVGKTAVETGKIDPHYAEGRARRTRTAARDIATIERGGSLPPRILRI